MFDFISNHSVLLLIPILLPVLGALFIGCVKLPARVRNLLTMVLTTLNAVLVWVLLLNRPEEPFVLYHFTDQLAITFKLDGLGSLFAGMTSLLWVPASLYAIGYMKHEQHQRMFFAFYLATFGVTEGICFSGNLITLFVFYEMLTLVTVPLVLHKFNDDALFAGRKYAVYSLGGSGLGLIGVLFLSVYADGTNFVLGGALQTGSALSDTMLLVVYLLAFLGFSVKAAVFPLHGWLTTASVAPTPVTALLHAVAVVKSGVFAILRLTYYNFGPDFLRGTWVQWVVLAMAIFTLLFGAAMAVRERHFKRRLAYSTVSNLSYILFGALLMSEAGMAAACMHLLYHGVMKITAFWCAGAFIEQTGRNYLWELDGVGRKMPVTFTCFTISGLALTGIPLFCGFLSKWQLIAAAVENGSVLAIVGIGALIVSAFLCAIYMFSVSVRAFFPKTGKDAFAGCTERIEAPWTMLVPIVLLTAVNVILGLWGQPVLSLVTAIAAGQF